MLPAGVEKEAGCAQWAGHSCVAHPGSCVRHVPAWSRQSRCICSSPGCWCTRGRSPRCSGHSHTRRCLQNEAHEKCQRKTPGVLFPPTTEDTGTWVVRGWLNRYSLTQVLAGGWGADPKVTKMKILALEGSQPPAWGARSCGRHVWSDFQIPRWWSRQDSHSALVPLKPLNSNSMQGPYLKSPQTGFFQAIWKLPRVESSLLVREGLRNKWTSHTITKPNF